MANSRHIPERTCVACGLKMPKSQLVRLIQAGRQSIAIDTTGTEPGRGAYLCRTSDCWDRALRKGSLERSFRQSICTRDLERVGIQFQENLLARG